MEAKEVDVERGWGWIVDGWSLFIKNPGVWVLMILVVAILVVLLSFVPLLGELAIGFLGTMLSGGILYGASRLDMGGSLKITHLIHAFQDAKKTGPMMTLGVLALVISLLMGLVSKGLLTSVFVGGGMMAAELSMSTLFGALLLLLLVAALMALLFYAIPLVILKGEEPFDAIRLSITGALYNWLPLLVFGLICSVLSVLAIIPRGLGFLILGPVVYGAWYKSYKDIYTG